MTTRIRKAKTKVEPPPGMTFETALTHLRRGELIRRRGWNNATTKLFRLDGNVYVDRPHSGGPKKWSPWADDILASDWELAEHLTPESARSARRRSGDSSDDEDDGPDDGDL